MLSYFILIGLPVSAAFAYTASCIHTSKIKNSQEMQNIFGVKLTDKERSEEHISNYYNLGNELDVSDL